MRSPVDNHAALAYALPSMASWLRMLCSLVMADGEMHQCTTFSRRAFFWHGPRREVESLRSQLELTQQNTSEGLHSCNEHVDAVEDKVQQVEVGHSCSCLLHLKW